MEIGTDIIEIERIERILIRFPRVKRRLFTEREIAYCERQKRPAQHFAARFAAKESVVKSLGIRRDQTIRFGDIEIVIDDHGKPVVALHGQAQVLMKERRAQEIKVSVSHCAAYAVASALLLSREKIDMRE